MRKDLEHFLFFMLVVPAWKMLSGTSETTCPRLRFTEPRSPANVVTVEEGRDVNETFYLDSDGCHDTGSSRVVVVSADDHSFRVPVCKIIFYGNRTCEVSQSSGQCACVNATLAQFRLRGSLPTTRKFFWSVSDSVKGNLQGEVTVTFRVISKASTVYANTTQHFTEDSNTVSVSPLTWAIMAGPMFVAGVVASSVVVWCIARRRASGRKDENDEHLNEREQGTTAFENGMYKSRLARGEGRGHGSGYEDADMLSASGTSRGTGRRDGASTYLRPV